MKNIYAVFSFLFLTTSFLVAQTSTRLVTITEGSPVNYAGLGVRFTGKVMDDGLLYFRGSSNGLREAIWKTDATIAGTSKVIEDETQFGSNWDELRFINEGALVLDNGTWNILKPGDDQFTPLLNMPEERISNLKSDANGSYYFTVERDDNVILYKANSSLTDVSEKGILHPDQSFLLLTTGPFGAVMHSTSGFAEDMPAIYLSATDEIKPITEYYESIGLAIADHTYSYVIDNFLLVSYKDEDNFFRNKIVNMEDGSISDFMSVREPIEHFYYNDKLFLATEREVVAIDPSDMTFNSLFGNVFFSFTPTKLVGNKYYFLSSDEEIVELNLDTEIASVLKNSNTGNSFYSSRFEFHKGEFFYIQGGSIQALMKYDFENETAIFVDTLSINTGATVEHALVEVNDELVISKRLPLIQHELYALGIISDLDDVQFEDLKIYPTIADDQIQVDFNSKVKPVNSSVLILTINGSLVDELHLDENTLNISHLLTGSYIGIVKGGDQLYRFRFIKN